MTSKENVLKGLETMQKYFGKKLEPSIIPLYLDNLSKMDERLFNFTLQEIIETFHPTATVPFPMISDFVERANQYIQNNNLGARVI